MMDNDGTNGIRRHSRTSSVLNGDHHDDGYNETLSQIYDTALDHSSFHKTSSHFRRKELQVLELDRQTYTMDDKGVTEHRKRSDSSSTSTASSDGTPPDFDTTLVGQQDDEPELFLASALKEGPNLSVKQVVSSQVRRGWNYLFGSNKPIQVFLEAARYPPEVRQPC